jgi:hypothetical protein
MTFYPDEAGNPGVVTGTAHHRGGSVTCYDLAGYAMLAGVLSTLRMCGPWCLASLGHVPVSSTLLGPSEGGCEPMAVSPYLSSPATAEPGIRYTRSHNTNSPGPWDREAISAPRPL